MGSKSAIQWTDVTWNVARGCRKVDDDCKFCYMYRDGDRFGYDAKNVFKTKSVFNLPLRIKEPSKIFTCSLTDFFIEEIDEYRHECWDIIKKCPHHTFQILTKRPERISECLPDDWSYDNYKNVWIGVSIGSQKAIHRLYSLCLNERLERHIKFLSLEPMHGEILLPEEPHNNIGFQIQEKIDWIIVGGESGNESGKHRYRPCELEWIDRIVDYGSRNNIPVFIKQLGTYLAKRFCLSGAHGGNIDEFPENMRLRQFPAPHSS